MLDLTGDAAALTEVRAALDIITTQDHLDLTSALHLAYHRDQLTDRNTNTPTSLPAVWATTVAEQAEQTVRSITAPDRQVRALATVAQALARVGHHEQARLASAAACAAGRLTAALAPLLGLDPRVAGLLLDLVKDQCRRPRWPS